VRLLAALTLAVSGNHLVNGAGQTVRLLGVNRSGAEYACVQGWGFFDGPTDAASIAAMKAWRINAVRIPLNESCWLGINGVKPQYGGTAYHRFVQGFVGRLNRAGLIAILDLHWNVNGQEQMPDAAHSPAFWRSVARTFRANGNVIFDLYNEPHDVTWQCWRDGCGPWAGMQQLVNVIRAAGARQPLMLGGLAWSNDLSGWLRWRPRDPLHRLVASFHLYNFNTCDTVLCWQTTIAPVARVVPVVTGELGENDCAHGFIDTYMPWADARGISYVGWAWDAWNCNSGPALISGYDGTPTPFGAGFRDHLALLHGR
jgi:endoglucanase